MDKQNAHTNAPTVEHTPSSGSSTLCGQVSCIIIKLGVSFRSKWECFVCKSARTLGLCGHCLCENLKKLRFSIPHHLEKGHKAVCCMLLLLNFLLLFSSTRWSSARFGKRNPTQTGRTPPFSASVCWGVNVSAAPPKSRDFTRFLLLLPDLSCSQCSKGDLPEQHCTIKAELKSDWGRIPPHLPESSQTRPDRRGGLRRRMNLSEVEKHKGR